jgi:putative flippase GtrA
MSQLINIATFLNNRDGTLKARGFGSLSSLEVNKDIPFSIKRVYYIQGVSPNIVRGGHKHKHLKQILICLSGKYEVTVHDGKERQVYILDKSTKGLLLNPQDWHSMKCLKKDSTLLVLASEKYDPESYVTEKKLSSLTIFVPFRNDEGTVERQIHYAYLIGTKVSEKVQVIAIHGGSSQDKTYQKIKKMKKLFPKLKIIDKTNNKEGYAVIKHGFLNVRNDFVFYTDGDAQYHLEEDLTRLVDKYFETGADVVNGYKSVRSDNFIRVWLGKLYAYFAKFLFDLPIRDVDCDFRLIRNKVLKKIKLESKDASILPELIKKLELSGATFAEVPVAHYSREYGTSNYTPWSLFKEKFVGDIRLYLNFRKKNIFTRSERLVRFLSIGVVSVAVQALIFNILLVVSDIRPSVNAIIADQFAIVLSYYLNGKYAFHALQFSNYTDSLRKFIKFYFSMMSSTVIQAVIIFINVQIFGRSFIVANLAYILGILVAIVWNYFLQSRVVWKNSPVVGSYLYK